MEERQAFGTMHVKDGWNFQRVDDGAVRIYKTDPNGPSDQEASLLAEITIPGNEWESVIAAVSAHGDSARGFSIAQAFHRAAGNLHLDLGDISEDAVRGDNVTDG